MYLMCLNLKISLYKILYLILKRKIHQFYMKVVATSYAANESVVRLSKIGNKLMQKNNIKTLQLSIETTAKTALNLKNLFFINIMLAKIEEELSIRTLSNGQNYLSNVSN